MSIARSVIFSLSILFAPLGATMMDLSEVIPSEERVIVDHLQNGARVFIHSQAFPSNSGSVKVRFKIESSKYNEERNEDQDEENSWFQDSFFSFFSTETGDDDITYTLEFQAFQKTKIEKFFSYCREEIERKAADNPYFRLYIASHPNERLSIVAVGDFPTSEMQELITEYFSSISFVNFTDESKKEFFESGNEPTLLDVKFSLSYPFNLKPIVTLGDLKDQWACAIFQELLHRRLEKRMDELDVACDFTDAVIFFPSSSFKMSSDTSDKKFWDLLSLLLAEIDIVRKWGFTQNELEEVKSSALSAIYFVSQSDGQCSYYSMMSSYYLERFMGEDDAISFGYFLNASEYLISGITADDLFEKISSILDPENCQIEVETPSGGGSSPISQKQVRDYLQNRSSPKWNFEPEDPSGESHYMFASTQIDHLEDMFALAKPLIRNAATDAFVPQTDAAAQMAAMDVYNSLSITDDEKKTINTIITTMAEKNIIRLGLMRKTMEKKGKSIHHVHPFRFLGYVFSNPHLKSAMHKIRKSGFKWDGFIDGYSKKMKEEAKKDNLMRYVPGFCQYLNISQAEVTRLIQKRDYEGLVKHLL